MSSQVFVASTATGLAAISAALTDGAFPAADRRVLVLSNNASIPETAPGVTDTAGTAPLLEAFDDVYSYNDLVAPARPATWSPRAEDLIVWERALRALWSLEGDVHLVVENLQVVPALSVCQTFADAGIDVYADQLTVYGPSRSVLPAQVSTRLQRLLHLDLVPGVRPLLLREHGITPIAISVDSFLKVTNAITTEAGPAGLAVDGRPTAVLLGDHLTRQGWLSEDEEADLHLQMVEQTVAAGFTELLYRPHPGARAGLTGALLDRAQSLGARLGVRDAPELIETWYASGEVDLVVGCLSTALATAAFYGVPAARVGTELLLDRLNATIDLHRMPATILTATVPELDRLSTTDGETHGSGQRRSAGPGRPPARAAPPRAPAPSAAPPARGARPGAGPATTGAEQPADGRRPHPPSPAGQVAPPGRG